MNILHLTLASTMLAAPLLNADEHQTLQSETPTSFSPRTETFDYVRRVEMIVGPLHDTLVDHSTDAHDTIDWLVKHVPESNGRVGIFGISYDGFTSLMATVHPHSARRAAVPINACVDGWCAG